MFRFRFIGHAGLALACALLASLQAAAAFELSGAWATQADLCNKVFTTMGSQVTFTELSDLYGSGFIVNGKRIVGKAARCGIESTKQDGNSIELAAACATTIMNQEVKFSLNVVDDNTIERRIEEIPGMTIRYFRCKI